MDRRTRIGRTERAIWIAPVLIVFAACGGGDAVVDPALIAAGEKHYGSTCATCHGPDARGVPRLGKDLHSNEFVQSRTDAELVDFLKVGRPAGSADNERGVDMPPRGGNPALKDEDMQAIVAYLRTLK